MHALAPLASLLLAISGTALATTPNYHHNVARQSAQQAPVCPPTSSGGRKVGIVVDSSGSNADTDPQNLRIAAAKQLNAALVTQAQATAQGLQPDLVTAIDFDSSADVIYPLGDPAGAGPTFDKINANGGTYIAGGLKAAIDEITKASAGTTAGRSGVVVLTDGEDSSLKLLIDQVNRAQAAGIRVSFGFLSPSTPAGASDLLSAILATGGVYATITNAAAQQSFVNLVLTNGITAADNGSGNAFLFPGLVTASETTKDKPKTFTYSAQAGEKLAFTVTSINKQELDVVLKDTKANKDISATKTDAKGVAVINYEAQAAIELGLVVSTQLTTNVLFTVGVNSSLGQNYSNPCVLPPTNTTGPGKNTTYTPPTHKPTGPATSTVYVCPTCPPQVVTYACPVCPGTYTTKTCNACPYVTATVTGVVSAVQPTYTPGGNTPVAPTAGPGGASATVTGGTVLYTGGAASLEKVGKGVIGGVGAIVAAMMVV